MVQVAVAPPARETYWGAIAGGYAVGGSGSLMLLILAVIGVASNRTIPSGLIGLALGLLVIGAAIVVTAYPMRSMAAVMARLDEHQADRMGAALDAQDLVVVKNQAAATAAEVHTIVGEVHQLHEDMRGIKGAIMKVASYLVRLMSPAERDEAWMNDMAESMRIGRELELRRPQED